MEFEFFLAAELRMTVGELRARMDNGEFRRWLTYYGRRNQERELAQKRR